MHSTRSPLRCILSLPAVSGLPNFESKALNRQVHTELGTCLTSQRSQLFVTLTDLRPCVVLVPPGLFAAAAPENSCIPVVVQKRRHELIKAMRRSVTSVSFFTWYAPMKQISSEIKKQTEMGFHPKTLRRVLVTTRAPTLALPSAKSDANVKNSETLCMFRLLL